MGLHPFLVLALIFVGGASLFAVTVFVVIRSSWNRSSRPPTPVPLPLLGDEERAAALSRAGDKLGMRFEERPPLEAVEELQHFVLFSQGSRKTISKRLSGSTRGCRIEVFDYVYDFGANGPSGSGNSLIVLLKAQAATFPQFDLRPTTSAWVDHCWPGNPPSLLKRLYATGRTLDESLFGAVARQVKGFTRVDFPAEHRFGELYLVHADDPVKVKTLFSEEVVSYFERHPGVHVEAKDGTMVYWRGDQVLDGDPQRWLGSPSVSAADVRDLIGEALETFRLFREGNS